MTHRRTVFLALSGLLAGCSFKPVYMTTAAGRPGPAERNLAAIRIGPVPDRPGQELRQALEKRLGITNGFSSYRYDLTVSYDITGEDIGILSDTTSTRIRLIAKASYLLETVDIRPRTIAKGSAQAADGFNVIDQQYFAASLSNDQADRYLANAIADSIAMQLAAFFNHRAAMVGH